MEKWKTRNRYFNAILYEEDANYSKYMQNIINNYKEVTYINHDRDIDEDGNIKKKHTHILFCVGNNARSIKAVAKEIGIAENYLQGTKKIPFLRYLIHYDNQEKTQYNIEEVHGELKEQLKEIIQKDTKEDITIAEITTKILNREIRNNTDLILYAINMHQLYTIRKYHYILNLVMKEEREREQIEIYQKEYDANLKKN